MFSACLSVRKREGGTDPRFFPRSLVSGPFGGATPVLAGVHPGQDWVLPGQDRGVLPTRTRVLPQSPGMENPNSRDKHLPIKPCDLFLGTVDVQEVEAGFRIILEHIKHQRL